MTTPFVSIIIVTWNTSQVTLKCLDTIRQHLPHSFYELIVIDNGSTDDTKKVITSQSSVIYHNTGSNLGFSKACNIGAKIATTKLLFFLNSDMELIDNKLIDMVSFLQTTPDCGLVSPKFLNPDKSVQGSVFPPQTAFNAFQEFWLGHKSYSKYVPKSISPHTVWAVSGGAVLISKNLFNLVGGWNEKYFMYFEDLQLCSDVRRLNYKIYYYPQFRLIHHHGASGKQLASSDNQWRRLIPSSILFHGKFNHYLINSIIWSGQKISKLF